MLRAGTFMKYINLLMRIYNDVIAPVKVQLKFVMASVPNVG